MNTCIDVCRREASDQIVALNVINFIQIPEIHLTGLQQQSFPVTRFGPTEHVGSPSYTGLSGSLIVVWFTGRQSSV